ncbi:enoyl-CoA delta isomerase 1, mitochondrial-like [Montipora capricornis]|uniref:enoyl-CoA delta isomerase 1, mitochondrial-like n=1 Tax=Montipora capricornis TaxID=246305 RepID=UPI0035F1CF91
MAQFKIGEETGHKVDPVSVSRAMRKAKNADGARLFSSEEFLTSRQIASFFSRVSKKKVVPDELDTQEEAEIEQDAAEALRERTLEEACSDVHAILSIKHPILYDVYNLCELTAQNEMGRFSNQMLKEMCSAFDLDPRQISDKRRKQPYIDLGHALAGGCVLGLACDYRIMADGPRIGLVETEAGVPPPFWVFDNLAAVVGKSVAEKAVLSSKRYTAEEALSIGLVDKVVPRDKVLEAAKSQMEEWTLFSARTLEITKRVMRRDAVEALESKREEDIKEFVDCITDEDVQKAIGMQIDRITKKK